MTKSLDINIVVSISDPYRLIIENSSETTDLILQVIRRGGLRVSDTDFSYRQINYLSTKGLLNPELKDVGWRSFDFRDLVYLFILSDLKLFSLSNRYAESIHALFYTKDVSESVDMMILACLIGIEMTLVYLPTGKGFVLCPNNLEGYEAGLSTQGYGVRTIEIRLTVNSAVSKALKSSGIAPRKQKIPRMRGGQNAKR